MRSVIEIDVTRSSINRDELYQAIGVGALDEKSPGAPQA